MPLAEGSGGQRVFWEEQVQRGALGAETSGRTSSCSGDSLQIKPPNALPGFRDRSAIPIYAV